MTAVRRITFSPAAIARMLIMFVMGLLATLTMILASALVLILGLMIPILIGWGAAQLVPAWAAAVIGLTMAVFMVVLLRRQADRIGSALRWLSNWIAQEEGPK